ncbi:MAG: amino acid ABC transporter permease [Actinomycetota bacterium]|nr:amino acid ABC transporter permease [Actinomycetota bacterium]
MAAQQVEIGGIGETRPPDPVRTEGGALSFRVKVALVWIGIFAAIGVLFYLSSFDIAWMRTHFKFIVTGVWVTIVAAVISIVLATILALFGALGRLSRNPIAYGISGFYTSFFRGTPLIVQIFLIYLALPQIGLSLQVRGIVPAAAQKYFLLSAIFAGILALGLNYGAYMTEIFRAGILAVGPGQTEAADALGMSYPQRMRRVVLPQAFKVIIPPTGNEFIAMIKDTALLSLTASAVFWYDLFKRATVAGSAGFRNLEALIVTAGIYWLLTAIFTFFQSKLEARISKGYVREGVTPPKPGRTKFVTEASAAGGGGAMAVDLPDPKGAPRTERGSTPEEPGP